MYTLINFFCAPYMWIMGRRHRRHRQMRTMGQSRTVRAELLPTAKQILL